MNIKKEIFSAVLVETGISVNTAETARAELFRVRNRENGEHRQEIYWLAHACEEIAQFEKHGCDRRLRQATRLLSYYRSPLPQYSRRERKPRRPLFW